MITVTISGERASGKSQLARTLWYLLNRTTNYDAVIDELHMTKEFQQRNDRELGKMSMDTIKELDGRSVAIVVINPGLPADFMRGRELPK